MGEAEDRDIGVAAPSLGPGGDLEERGLSSPKGSGEQWCQRPSEDLILLGSLGPSRPVSGQAAGSVCVRACVYVCTREYVCACRYGAIGRGSNRGEEREGKRQTEEERDRDCGSFS